MFFLCSTFNFHALKIEDNILSIDSFMYAAMTLTSMPTTTTLIHQTGEVKLLKNSSILAGLSLLAINAALSGEQRKPPDLNYCAVNT
ncbi:hypothetical protein PPBDW_I21106 [Photobacterium kishitanii]|nr:hypothetical protein PPBDW_I21106 [Photobacterium kishitanii]